MKCVIDASVALKWILSPLNEPNAIDAARILGSIRESDAIVFAPPHWFAEIIAVVARMEPDRIDDALDLLHAIPVEIVDGRRLLGNAAKLSRRLGHHLFDTLYHAVAIEQDATLNTADERYFEKARELGKIHLLGRSQP